MDGLNAASGPQDDAGQTSSDNHSNSALNDALNAALTALPDEEVPNFGEEEETASIPEMDAERTEPADTTESHPDPELEATTETPPEPQADIPEAPQHWPKERQDAFAKLDPEARKAFLDLDKDWNKGFTQKTQELAEYRKVAQAIHGLFTDAERNELQARGMSELDMFQTYRQLDNLYRHNPVQYVQQVVQLAGLKPEQVFPDLSGQSQSSPDGEEWIDPDVQAVRFQVGELNSRFDSWQRQQQEIAQREQMQRQQSTAQMINQFAAEQDDAGSPRFPHFGTVQEQMAMIMQTDPQIAAMPPSRDKLAAAYDLAVHANPELRGSLIEAEVAKRLSEKEKAQQAEKLKSASTPKPRPGATVPASQKPQGLDAIISQAMRGAGL